MRDAEGGQHLPEPVERERVLVAVREVVDPRLDRVRLRVAEAGFADDHLEYAQQVIAEWRGVCAA